jgi:23S rRNA pseudoU1915 N3-methylase RlmH
MDVNEHERLSNITLRHKLVRKVMDVNEHERLSNITLRHKLVRKGYGCKWTWETIQHYT